MSAMDAWRATERVMLSQGLTVHNLGKDIWEVAEQMQAAIAELEAERDAIYERRLPYREAEVAQKRYEKAEAELAAVGSDLQDEVEYTITLRERAEKAEAELDAMREKLWSYQLKNPKSHGGGIR